MKLLPTRFYIKIVSSRASTFINAYLSIVILIFGGRIGFHTFENDLTLRVYVYVSGEVNVAQDQLPAFLKTAERLKVKGLAEAPQTIKQE